MSSRRKAQTNPSHDLRERILESFQTLRVPLSSDELDAALAQAEKERWSALEFLSRLIGPQADQRRQRAIERRIGEARFHESKTLAAFDWVFNAQAIDRAQIESLAAGDFIRRGDNLVIAGQSGVGKSHIVQSVGRAACALGYRVRYITSADLLRDLTACLADHSLPQRLRYYSNFDLLEIDEFGFDKIERAESGQAASLLYKVVDSRGPKRSTAMVTNISFEAWADYLGDAPLAMAILDRLVDGAIVLKIEGRSYRAHRAQHPATPGGTTQSVVAEIPKSKRLRKDQG
jgi:DNA replication protein DnaC